MTKYKGKFNYAKDKIIILTITAYAFFFNACLVLFFNFSLSTPWITLFIGIIVFLHVYILEKLSCVYLTREELIVIKSYLYGLFTVRQHFQLQEETFKEIEKDLKNADGIDTFSLLDVDKLLDADITFLNKKDEKTHF